MDVSLRQLEIFRGVVIAGSITKASHRLGLSQPTISQRLAQLEELLDVQLLLRGRSGQVTMTPAGEFWFRSSEELIGRMSEIVAQHEQTFHESNLVLRMGTTPALRGRFTAAAARLTEQDGRFAKFELVFDLGTPTLVEKLRMHAINIAVVAETSMEMDPGAFAVAPLFEDRIAWAVPASIGADEVAYALSGAAHPGRLAPVLRRYVEIDSAVPLRQSSDSWYRTNLPWAQPTIGAPSYDVSVDFVAAGLATCHLPLSLLPNLPVAVRRAISVYVIPNMTRQVVLAMRKHLLSHPAFASIFHGLAEFGSEEYSSEMVGGELRCLSALAPAVTEDRSRKTA
jgi:DNA-binding transcriptional LysR family regulator